MKKYLSIVFSLFVLFAFAKCTSDDEQLKNNLNAVRTLSVVASMPGDGSDTKTRVVLSETDEGKNKTHINF